MQKLLENEPAVTSLLKTNPFADRPPVYVRAEFYDYRYPDSAAKERGMWWERRSLGLYFPVVRLRDK